MTLKLSSFTEDLCYNIVSTFLHVQTRRMFAECLQVYAVSAPFELELNFP